MKHRIKKVGDFYYPQYRILGFFWSNYYENGFVPAFLQQPIHTRSLSDACKIINEDIENERKPKTKPKAKYYNYPGDYQ